MGELDQIARELDGMTQGTSVVGRRNGVDVLLSLTTRGIASSERPWTEVRADLPPKYPLELHLFQQIRGTEHEVSRGMMVDVTVGNAAFDAAFVIEAAPTDVVRQLLDANTQQQLIAIGLDCQLETVHEGERVLLVLHVPRWLDDRAGAIAAIELVTGIASRVRDAFAMIEEEPTQGGPFREERDGAAERELAAQRIAEVAHAREVRLRRDERSRRFALAIGVTFLVGVALLVVMSARC